MSESGPVVGPIAAILLAAGASRRFGAENKLLAEISGTPMIVRVAHAVAAAHPPLTPLIVVTGMDAPRIRAHLESIAEARMRFVHNPEYEQGLSSSLRAGLSALPKECVAALICLGDMPWLEPRHIEALTAAFAPQRNASICVPMVNGRRGNPILWAARFFPRMAALRGDIGARVLLAEYADAVREVPFQDDAPLRDIDAPEQMPASENGTP